jgi:hypothetical protein
MVLGIFKRIFMVPVGEAAVAIIREQEAMVAEGTLSRAEPIKELLINFR